MTLRKRWRDLDRATVGQAPERYGYYELGTDGKVVDRGVGVLRDALKEALSYGQAEQARWETATSKEHADRLLADHE